MLLGGGLSGVRPRIATDPAPNRAEHDREVHWVEPQSRFGAHEAGHLLFDMQFDADPGLEKVDFHGIPFFAITHAAACRRQREFTISSAGFWVQHAGNEWLLTRRPNLRRERAPFAKGVLAFNVLTSVGVRGCGVREDRPARARHARHGRRIAGSTSVGRGDGAGAGGARCLSLLRAGAEVGGVGLARGESRAGAADCEGLIESVS